MTKKKELSVEEVATTPGLFVRRISSERCEVRGTIFTLKPLSKNVKRYIVARLQEKMSHPKKEIKGAKKEKQLTEKELAKAERELVTENAIRTLEYISLTFRFGCINIEGLKDEKGKDVEVIYDTITIEGSKHKILSEETTLGLSDDFVTLLGMRMSPVNSLTEEELRKLDFTKSSLEKEENV